MVLEVLDLVLIGLSAALGSLLGVGVAGAYFASHRGRTRLASLAADSAASPEWRAALAPLAADTAERALAAGFDALAERWSDADTRAQLLGPVWDYFERRLNLRVANATKGATGSPIPAGGLGGLAGLPTGDMGAIVSMIPGLSQFAPLLGLLGGNQPSQETPSPPSSGPFTPGVKR